MPNVTIHPDSEPHFNVFHLTTSNIKADVKDVLWTMLIHGTHKKGADSLFEQIRKNHSSVRLITLDERQIPEIKSINKIQRIESERGIVNALKEALGLDDQEKGLIVVDLRKMTSNQQIERVWHILSAKNENRWLAIKEGPKNDVYTLISAIRELRIEQETKMKLRDLCPSILAATGANINFNNNGLVRKQIL